jgi:hypothetical protein
MKTTMTATKNLWLQRLQAALLMTAVFSSSMLVTQLLIAREGPGGGTGTDPMPCTTQKTLKVCDGFPSPMLSCAGRTEAQCSTTQEPVEFTVESIYDYFGVAASPYVAQDAVPFQTVICFNFASCEWVKPMGHTSFRCQRAFPSSPVGALLYSNIACDPSN